MGSNDSLPSHKQPRVAIVGGGISGIACSWELQKHACTVDIYEAESRLGGHANSVAFQGNGETAQIDTGFIVMEESNYRLFSQFLNELGVDTIPTNMSFGVSSSNLNGHEWSSNSLWSFVRNLSNLFRARFWRLVLDIIWFYTFADDILLEGESRVRNYMDGPDVQRQNSDNSPLPTYDESIGTYLQRNGYSMIFITQFLIPMLASPWSTDPDVFAETFPARLLIQFMLKYSLLNTITDKMQWRSFRNGSREYVTAFQKQISFRHRIHLNTVVHRVARNKNVVSLRFADGSSSEYDHVFLAIHAHQALELLGSDATALEHKILSSFKTTKNVCVLHSDTTFLAQPESFQTAWTCFLDTEQCFKQVNAQEVPAKSLYMNRPRISVTFDINKVQGIPLPGTPGSPGRVLVTLNPYRVPKLQQGMYIYEHPLITSESFSMAHQIHNINGIDKISFAGAWMGFGFHEDGFMSGAHAARTFIHGRDEIGKLDLFSFSNHSTSGKLSVFKVILQLIARILNWFH
ncbi:FAD/NAD(P)-binding domain-containing protein [Xylaria sp. FL0064]|nr:FAD/NAD(P)-binding domain-containing protein [Xylaria sp. FL0064]